MHFLEAKPYGRAIVSPRQRALVTGVRSKQGCPMFAGGYNRATFAVGDWCPIAIEGAGYLLVDELGNELIDLNNNFTSLIHGHAHPQVVAAGQAALSRGASFGLPNIGEIRHARALLSRFNFMDQVRYANSGTEAVMAAVRVARAHTGRDLIILLERAYHGLCDVALAAGGARGVPRGVSNDVMTVPINDREALRAVFESAGDRIAAFLMDLMPNRAGLIAVDDDFAGDTRALTQEFGSLLIVDEVISARLGYRGYAEARGVIPDVIILGKIIGGGLPVGAVLGKANVMARFSDSNERMVEMGGTFTGNPVTMLSGLAALELFDFAEIERLNGLGKQAREQLRVRLSGRKWEVRGEGSLVRAVCTRAGVDVAAAQLQVWHAAYRRGVLILPNGLASLSTPMDAEVVSHAVDCLADAMIEVDEDLWRGV
jgi:glutamate-1-semialdehyde 2,1-aminomutase